MHLANKIHEVLFLLEREQFPLPNHPRSEEIFNALYGPNGLRSLALAHAAPPFAGRPPQAQAPDAHLPRSNENGRGAQCLQQHAAAPVPPLGHLHLMHMTPAGKKRHKPSLPPEKVDAIDKVYVQGLKQAKALLDEGILTQEEFERQKKALLNEREVAVQRAQTESQRAAALAHTHATQGAVVEVGGGESASQDCLQGYAAAIAEHATTPENGEVAAGKEKKRRRLGKEELVFFRLLEEKERHVCAHCSKIFGTLQASCALA